MNRVFEISLRERERERELLRQMPLKQIRS